MGAQGQLTTVFDRAARCMKVEIDAAVLCGELFGDLFGGLFGDLVGDLHRSAS
jgi:hypothetical protein